MAETLTLSDAYGSISLLNTGGLNVLFGGGAPQRAVDPDERVIDTYACKVIGTSDNDLAAQLQALNRMLENAARYEFDPTEENLVGLSDQLPNESHGRITVVLGGSWQFDSNPHSTPTPATHTAFITLAIKHLGAWEPSIGSFSSLSTIENISIFGGYADLSAIATGDMPTRIIANVIGHTGAVDTIWIGFRSQRKHPELSTFHPIWTAVTGTLSNNTASTSDATATNGNAALVSFADSNWAQRVKITAGDVAGNDAGSHTGRFLILGRMRLDSGTDVVQVRLQSGWTAGSAPQYKTLDPVTISGTAYDSYELGTVKFPANKGMLSTGALTTASLMANAGLSLLAARVSGTTSKLLIDHFALVPIDEGFGKASGLNLGASTVASFGVGINNKPTTSLTDTSRNVLSSVAFTQQNFFLPLGTSYAYVFGKRSTGSVLGDTVDMSPTFARRFFSLRGSA